MRKAAILLMTAACGAGAAETGPTEPTADDRARAAIEAQRREDAWNAAHPKPTESAAPVASSTPATSAPAPSSTKPEDPAIARERARLEAEIAATKARIAELQAHVDQCKASYAPRAASAKKLALQTPALRSTRDARCKRIQPKCTIAASGTFSCTGSTADDVQYFGAVCMVWKQQVWLDESGECDDTDRPVLRITEANFAAELNAIANLKP